MNQNNTDTDMENQGSSDAQNQGARDQGKVDEQNASQQPGDRHDASEHELVQEDSQEGKDGMTLEHALEQLRVAEATIEAQREDVLRVQAEMQNLRRRTDQDIERAHKYGQEKFTSELLVVIDNLERALQAVENKDDELLKALCEGVELTLKSFLDCFRKFSVEQIDPLGEPFNPQLHQAVVMQESADVEPDTVLSVMQKGYTLHGRVIRPAMVIVSRAASPNIDEKA